MASKECIFTILVIITLLPLFTSRIIPEISMSERHKEWMARFKCEYSNALEKEERFKIFQANVEYIDTVNNAEGISYKLSVNQFADMTSEEFSTTYKSNRNSYTTKSATRSSFRHENITDVPLSMDWRQKGAVTPIRSKMCGAWTFPAVDTIEGITKINTGNLYTLSVQEIIDCDSNGGGNSCSGGFMTEAFDFIKQTHHKNQLPTYE